MDPHFQMYTAQSSGGGSMFMSLVMFVIFHFIGALPLYKIAEKVGAENPWMAWIPIANVLLVLSIAGKAWWWLILMFIPLVGIIVALVVLWSFAEGIGQAPWMGLLLIIPLVNLALLYYWAFAANLSRT